MIGFTKQVSQHDDEQEPRTGRITVTSVLVMVAILGVALVNQYLSLQ